MGQIGGASIALHLQDQWLAVQQAEGPRRRAAYLDSVMRSAPSLAGSVAAPRQGLVHSEVKPQAAGALQRQEAAARERDSVSGATMTSTSCR